MHRHLVLSLLIALPPTLAVGAAAPRPAPPPPATPPTAPSAPAPSAPASSAPASLVALPVTTATLDVQSTGADPKVTLRPALRPGDTMSIEFTTEGLVTRFGEGVPRQLDRPLTVRWALDLLVDQVGPAGTATLAATVRDVSIEPHPSNPATQVAQTTAAVAPFKGRTFQIDLSPDGALAGVRVPAEALGAGNGAGNGAGDGAGAGVGAAPSPPPAVAQLVESLSMLFRPLPQVPVGKGARWQARTDRTIEGVDRIEVVTTTLESIEPADIRAKLAAVIRPQRDRARVADERMPGSRLVSIAQLSGSGGGTVRWNGGYLPSELREQILSRLVLEGVAKDDPNDNGPRRYLEEQVLVGVRVSE